MEIVEMTKIKKIMEIMKKKKKKQTKKQINKERTKEKKKEIKKFLLLTKKIWQKTFFFSFFALNKNNWEEVLEIRLKQKQKKTWQFKYVSIILVRPFENKVFFCQNQIKDLPVKQFNDNHKIFSIWIPIKICRKQTLLINVFPSILFSIVVHNEKANGCQRKIV